MELSGNAAKERKALVVGGTGDIGRAICLSLADEGIELTIHGGHDRDKLINRGGILRPKGGISGGLLKKIRKRENRTIGLKLLLRLRSGC